MKNLSKTSNGQENFTDLDWCSRQAFPSKEKIQ